MIQKVTPQPQVIHQSPPSVYLQSNASSIVQSSQQSAPCFAQKPQNIPIQNQMIVQRPLPQN